ncbi:hypothetical protein [Methylorubrum extorquens]|uniref:hypothetical protein n=1 Tax=Methylorubrum extorquens TaxID=408 RepID=UPI00167F57E7|nr:hypothetical protein [Methylorubrum extorquens]
MVRVNEVGELLSHAFAESRPSSVPEPPHWTDGEKVPPISKEMTVPRSSGVVLSRSAEAISASRSAAFMFGILKRKRPPVSKRPSGSAAQHPGR